MIVDWSYFFAFVSSVSFHVPLQVLGFVAGVGALLASKRFFVSVDHCVDLECVSSIGRIITFLTLGFSSVWMNI